MDDTLRRQEFLFSEALSMSPEERVTFLIRECGNDGALLRRIEELLDAARQSSIALLGDAEGRGRRTAVCGEPADVSGEIFGRYLLVAKLGEGGSGVVYEAEQTEPVRRRVALKLMRAGLDTAAAVSRFEAERQVLALMEHPNIARVYDAGATEAGRLYFVMELVRGTRITDFCDRERFSIKQRLTLFESVCQAVQHAHQKGVIHRDLKASNLLVTAQEGGPVVKVIDFGIAKVPHSLIPEQSMVTMADHFFGTPAYMSPEQAEWGARGVDTRSDVYSLGVVLYELLTGETPLAASELKQLGFDAMRAAVREREAEPPSRRIQRGELQHRTLVAGARGVRPEDLPAQLRGDLDAIVLKCLEKDPRRRYASVHELVLDLQRHAREEPVQAHAQGATYLVRKFVRRNRKTVLAAAVLGTFLTTATVVSAVAMARRARAEREEARVFAVFEDVLDGIGQTGGLPDLGLDRASPLWRAMLDDVSARTTAKLQQQPRIESEVRHVLGKIHLASGNYDKGADMLLRAYELRASALGTEHPDTIRALFDVGMARWMQNRTVEAERVSQEAIALRQKIAGPDDLEALHMMESDAHSVYAHGQAWKAYRAFEKTLQIRQRTGRVESLDNSELGPKEGLAFTALETGRLEEGERLARENLALMRRVLGPRDRRVARALLWVVWALKDQHRYEEAITLGKEAEEIQRATLENDHPQLSDTLYNLAVCEAGCGRYAAAEATCRESLTLFRARRPWANDVIYRLTTLATICRRQGKYAEAEVELSEALRLLRSDHSAPCGRHWGDLFLEGIALFSEWKKVRPAMEDSEKSWRATLSDVEEAILREQPSAYRTNAVRSVCNAYREWSKAEPSVGDRAQFWDQELIRTLEEEARRTGDM